MIVVSKSNIHGYGYGLFASRDISKGDIILESPFIDVTKVSKGIIADYVFGISDARLVIALDRASLINHSNNPNTDWDLVDDKIVFKAIKDIKVGDELFHDYGYCRFKINE